MKFPTLLGLLLTGASISAQADTVLGVYAGAQVWYVETDGTFFDETSSDSQIQGFNFDDETQGSFYIAFEHFVPLIPNVKINHTQLATSGTTQLSSTFTFNNEIFDVDASVFTDVDIATTDFILYYEIFDNDLFSIDLGLNGKRISGDLTIADDASGLQTEESFTGIVPLLYSRVEFNLPFSGVGVYAEGNYIDIDGNSLSDFQAGIKYDVIDSLALDLTLQAGYRDISIELDDVDDISSDLSFSGLYAGVEIHF